MYSSMPQSIAGDFMPLDNTALKNNTACETVWLLQHAIQSLSC